MAFVVGTRQVGKTTVCSSFQPAARTFNWDDKDHRRIITRGTAAIADELGLARLHEARQVVVFDELLENRRWRIFLNSLFDRHSADLSIVMTGSSRLDFYRKGGDSLMGRYFVHRLHPLSVGELVDPAPLDDVLRPPRPIAPRSPMSHDRCARSRSGTSATGRTSRIAARGSRPSSRATC